MNDGADVEHILRTLPRHGRSWAVRPIRDVTATTWLPSFCRTVASHVIPVNPSANEILGQRCYPDLGPIPEDGGVEVVDIFRRPEVAGAHVDEAIAIGAKAVWMQLGVIDTAAVDGPLTPDCTS